MIIVYSEPELLHFRTLMCLQREGLVPLAMKGKLEHQRAYPKAHFLLNTELYSYIRVAINRCRAKKLFDQSLVAYSTEALSLLIASLIKL